MRQTRIPMLALAALLAAPALASAQGSFEGTVTYQITEDGNRPYTMVYYVKGDKARAEIPYEGQKSVVLFDAAGHTTMMLPQQKMYIALPDLKDPTDVAHKHFSITRTGRTEVIAGRSCDDWQVQGEDHKEVTTMCVAKGMGNIVFARSRMERNRNAIAAFLATPQLREVMKGGFFPLKVSTTTDKGLWVATKIEPRTLSASLFEVPAGYQPLAMPTMPPGH